MMNLLSEVRQRLNITVTTPSYPINPTESEAYAAGVSRGVAWYLGDKALNQVATPCDDWRNGTAARCGEADGYETAAELDSVTDL